jgi:ATP-dependent helicase/nuclease subunit A
MKHLLAPDLPHAGLRNILALTFTNNAAREMHGRVLESLKRMCIGDEREIDRAARFLPLDRADLQAKSGELVESVFANYSDFQIKTIDSFLATVFRATAYEFGLHPDFEVVLGGGTLIDDAFEEFSRELLYGDAQRTLLDRLVELISEGRSKKNSYLWDPFEKIVEEVKTLYTMLSAQAKPAELEDYSAALDRLPKAIAGTVNELALAVHSSGLQPAKRFLQYVEAARTGDVLKLMERKLPDTPVNRATASREQVEAFLAQVFPQIDTLRALLQEYAVAHARSYYRPYIEAVRLIEERVDRLKRQRGQVLLGDMNKQLAGLLVGGAVPEVYIKLGDVIYHFLIDEFQDTSPIQWENLKPLVENSLSEGGSLYLVGDTKQSIYGFRGADWRIMKRLEEVNAFPSAEMDVRTLAVNYRSDGGIVEFTRRVFEEVVAKEPEVAEAARLSGLDRVAQQVAPGRENKGYVESCLIDESSGELQEKTTLLEYIATCQQRGYRYSDMVVIARENRRVVEVSRWLNESGIPFISHSSLDVRQRKITGELLALLRFLDVPVDDLAFATFVTGKLFDASVQPDATFRSVMVEMITENRWQRQGQPLYKAFQHRFGEIWTARFEGLYTRVGYLPLYDLVCEVCKVFDVFRCLPEEEAALVKILEVVRRFEERGQNSLKDFLHFAGGTGEETGWEMDVPTHMDAVSVMTIHKAKGLGYPVAVVLLRDMASHRSDVVLEETAEAVHVLRINHKLAEFDPTLAAVYTSYRQKKLADELNALYVSLTRAREELYVIAVYDTDRGIPTRLIPEGHWPETMPLVSERIPVTESVVPATHHNVARELAVGDVARPETEETRRGEAIHRLLSAVEILSGDPAGDTASAMKKLRIPHDDSLLDAVAGFLVQPDVRTFFEPRAGRRVLSEQELCTASGMLFRADRIVIDPDRLTVIDFKTGSDEAVADHTRQLKNYMTLLRDLHPDKTVTGLIAYVDLLKTVEIP